MSLDQFIVGVILTSIRSYKCRVIFRSNFSNVTYINDRLNRIYAPFVDKFYLSNESQCDNCIHIVRMIETWRQIYFGHKFFGKLFILDLLV